MKQSSNDNILDDFLKTIHEKMKVLQAEGKKFGLFPVTKDFVDVNGLTENGLELKRECLKTYRSFKLTRQVGKMGGSLKFEIEW